MRTPTSFLCPNPNPTFHAEWGSQEAAKTTPTTMKKFVFSLLTAILVVCNTHAQTSLVATLNHEGNITAYYGIDALSQAHSAAVNGDIITLSSGTFNACDITKAVTIRGAGMEYNYGMMPTVLVNNFKINVPTDSVNVLSIEGILHNNVISVNKASNPIFFKCRFGALNSYYNPKFP